MLRFIDNDEQLVYLENNSNVVLMVESMDS